MKDVDPPPFVDVALTLDTTLVAPDIVVETYCPGLYDVEPSRNSQTDAETHGDAYARLYTMVQKYMPAGTFIVLPVSVIPGVIDDKVPDMGFVLIASALLMVWFTVVV